jgi:hypothetical protein
MFHLYGNVTIVGEGLQNLGLCSVLRAFEQGGIFIVLQVVLWYETLLFPVSSKGPTHLVAFYDTQGDVEDLFVARIPTGRGHLKSFKVTLIHFMIQCMHVE